MKAVLQRGPSQLPAPAGSAFFSYSNSQTLYSYSHEEFGLITSVKKLWFSPIPEPLGEKGLLVSFQGWIEGQWYDGCLGRYSKANYTDLVLPGEACRLHIDSEDTPRQLSDWRSWAAENQCFAWKQSLIEALRARFSFEKNVQFTNLDQGGLNEASQVLNLLLFRLAFPAVAFHIVPPDGAWRRLAQNLAVAPKQQLSRFPQQSLALDWGSQESVMTLLRWQMSRSPFIPAKLWERLQGGKG